MSIYVDVILRKVKIQNDIEGRIFLVPIQRKYRISVKIPEGGGGIKKLYLKKTFIVVEKFFMLKLTHFNTK